MIRLLYVGYGGGAAGVNYGEPGITNAVTDKHMGDIPKCARAGTMLLEKSRCALFITFPKMLQVVQIGACSGRTAATWLSKTGIPVSLALAHSDH